MKKIVSLFIAVIMAFSLVSCSNDTSNAIKPLYKSDNGSAISVGSGSTHFDFTVVYDEEHTYLFHVHTDKTIVGEALQELGIIEGEEGDYGLYVKTVNGLLADYDVTGTYWAFYIDGAYATAGIDMTEIKANQAYELRVEQ